MSEADADTALRHMIETTPDYEPEFDATAPEFSDDSLALHFVELGAAHFRWSPGFGWMTDDGTVWRRDDELARYDLSRRVCRAAAMAAGAESEKRRLASAKTVNAVLALAQADRRIVVPASAWDADRLMLNTPGGMVNLRTGTIRPRGADYVTQATRIAPDMTAVSSLWLRFLDDVFEGDRDLIEFVRRAMGYWLTGDRREQVLFFLHGAGSNGKSTLVDLVLWLMGTYALKLPAYTLMQAKGERHPTEIAQLHGRRAAISSELEEGQFFNESLVKELTGDETMRARFMRADFFEFAMTHKHVIVGNNKPRLRGGDPAMARRILLVPFHAVFKGTKKDATLSEKLKAQAPAILAWLIKGAMDWAHDGLAVPESVRAASANYMAEHDDLAMWVAECTEREGEARASDLYASFSDWKRSRGEHAQSQTVWSQKLAALEGISKRTSNGVRYTGIRLTASEMERLNDARR